MSMKNRLTPAGIELATFRFVAQHVNHCATAVPNIKIYGIKILPFVLCGCETWSLTLREERRLNKVLKRIFEPKRDEVTGEWRKLHNDLNQYCSGNHTEKN